VIKLKAEAFMNMYRNRREMSRRKWIGKITVDRRNCNYTFPI